MKLIFPYGNDNIYIGKPAELSLDPETGEYNMPDNATDIPPLSADGAGMWRPKFDIEKNTWIETADQEYKDSLKKEIVTEHDPVKDQLYRIGQQLSAEKLARKQAEQGQRALGMQLTNEILARKQAEAVSKSIGEQLAALKLKVLELEGGTTSES
ncbi:hypothetical protein P8917_00860 [Bacillus atrophaeus]|uniref:hypothetical protein n=1 Tax=Bacillus atrophaeus TaxID=1452 RepID=UPI002280E99C|nr:hypothetical protein [Bacillus atrophaeus]MCY8813689.1 hypothetical protein [Bacillus atrophaeus]MCY8820238.1 hypothetical protein [Bacillus atrophaeus]MCY8828638.1 hypothetical protein [Bacillus atrophaeus]MCY8832725.1 hypothetical protein [Bacillus atrophaeus]MEC0749741.1 hypothetical protein [Bacillus atrophaeus]